ncbi:uncharacterized protein AB675_6824 [Cyphellophora attinorum]|uniref:Uncharacterized protein n=1 Tax=Cyphellophora attinorum TaxID=1664694 RepID=A0A0N1P0V3_9EURO|nr:uncharacterized protein AB675_6824 [Phialophora attinorum]KPI43386.1 hypothetical protein AB675_6824 [Phialophora attinorum]
MQSFNFASRQSAADGMDDAASRYVPSSIYSGGGQSRAPSTAVQFTPMPVGGPFQDTPRPDTHNGDRNGDRPRASAYLNVHDPVAMHLLAETAMVDSKDYEVLSYEELEQLKKEKKFLDNRVESTRRKLALEIKVRDAAQSLNRLYTPKGRTPSIDFSGDANGHSPPKQRKRNFLGSKGSINEASSRADDEYIASAKRVEVVSQELSDLEKRLETCDRRLLQHTAGILQMTHRGLKKNVRKTQLPHSPESMSSQNRNTYYMDTMNDFDERSLYQVPDYVREAHISGLPPLNAAGPDVRALDEMAGRLDQLAARMHAMIKQTGSQEHFEPPPEQQPDRANSLQNQLGYLEQGLDVMEGAHERLLSSVQSDQDTGEQLHEVNARLGSMLARTNSVSRSPVEETHAPQDRDLQAQLAFSSDALDRLNKRIDSLVEQKDILTRQIQQQRDLNSKSDAQRDARIHELDGQLETTKRQLSNSDQESQQLREQLNAMMEQLDQAKQESVLLSQRQDDRSALEEQQRQQQQELEKSQSDLQSRTQELDKSHGEMQRLESEIVRMTTELTMARAELDSAYGSRAQRAADVSSNPAVQKEIEDLKRELRETIEDYEVMTKQSIEAEKERDKYEERIDNLEHKCETLETQLNEEKVKWMGVKTGAPNDSTSAMVLKNEFKKMMRDTRAEQTRAYKAEQEERRRLEGILRQLRKENGQATPKKMLSPAVLQTGE